MLTMDCFVCGKKFATVYTMKRHMKNAHPADEVSDEDLSDESTDPIEEDEEDQTDDEVKDNESEGAEDEDAERHVWRSLIEDALEKLGPEQMQKHNITSAKDMLTEPGLALLIGKLCEETMALIENTKAITNGNLWMKIIQTTDELSDKGYDDDDDVDKMAWLQRKYAVRNLLEDNLDVIEQFLTDSDEPSDEPSPGD